MKKRTIILACLLTLSTIVSAQIKTAVIESYPLPAVYTASTVYSLQAGGNTLPAFQFDKKYDYAHFSLAASRAELVITLMSGEAITSFNLSPKKWNIPATAQGNQLHFTNTEDAYLSVKINAQMELVIVIDAREKQPPAETGK